MALPNNTFTGYSPDRFRQLAQSYGYNDANLAGFGKFLQANPSRAKQYFDQQNMDMFGPDRMQQFQAGGAVTPTIPNPYEAQIRELRRQIKVETGGGGDDLSGSQEQAIAGWEQQIKDYEQQWQQQQQDQQLKQDANTGTQVPVADPTGVIAPSPTGPGTVTPPVTSPPATGAPTTAPNQQFPIAGPPGFAPPTFTDPTQPIGTDPVDYYNPTTMQRWQAPSSGWTPPAGWQQGTLGAGVAQYYAPWQADLPPPTIPAVAETTAERVEQPQLPAGAAFQATDVPFDPGQIVSPAAGQVGAVAGPGATTAPVQLAGAPTKAEVPIVSAAQAAPAVQALSVAAQTLQAPTQTIEAAQAAQSQLANIQAQQIAQAVQIQAPDRRVSQAGEQIAAPTGQAAQAAEFVAPTAATAAPTEAATVQGQLSTLMQQFEAGEVPTWAAGAMRAANATLQQRGLGASSMAGQAVVQAAMEAALPIAQLDAATVAKFEVQNLSNRQQAAMVQAQYRAQFMQQEFDQAFQTRVQNAAKISDIANRNFTADQQIALENSRLAQTTNLQNLNNRQAIVMAQAGALAQLDIANLNNRQQAAVQNAQQFLQVDMKNLSNLQQAAMMDSQQQVQALMTDAAAQNVANQMNAKSQQQVDQYYDGLIASIGQQNALQVNAISQFNAGQVNALARYNSELRNQRDQFNAKNQLAIEQSNAVWRREIATADTAAANFESQFNAQNLMNMSNEAYDNLWQEYRDTMEWAWTSAESSLDRFTNLEEAQLNANARLDLAEFQARKEGIAGISEFMFDIAFNWATRGATRGGGTPAPSGPSG